MSSKENNSSDKEDTYYSDVDSFNSEGEDDDYFETEEENESENENEFDKNVIVYYKENSSKCGYCKSTTPTSFTYGAWALYLRCSEYQDMIDMGWRRSGKYCYKPILNKSCCPQNTIRLRSKEFKISKSHKKVLKKMEKFLLKGDQEISSENEAKKDSFKFPNVNSPESLMKWFDCIKESNKLGGKKLTIRLCKSKFEEETFNLYKKYQVNVHKDKPEEVTESGFKSFLVNSPLIYKDNGSEYKYGSYHQKYYIDNKLVAVGVIDILPKCLSSVYFMYDTDYSFLSLGVFSALQEISFSLILNKTLQDLKYYYLGFYIHSCPKMIYKAQYYPSDLLDPEYYTWVPYKLCVPLFEKNQGYVPFIKKLKEENHPWVEGQDPSAQFSVPEIITEDDLSDMKIFKSGYLVRYDKRLLNKEEKENLIEIIKILGIDLAKKIFINVSE